MFIILVAYLCNLDRIITKNRILTLQTIYLTGLGLHI